MKIDILAIGAHPDDVELSCSGTLIRHITFGKTVGILDLTLGELGTRGDAVLRKKEAAEGARIIGARFRDNMEFKDGFFENNPEHQHKLIARIRQYCPDIILCNAVTDRHPDHGRAAALVSEAAFYSGLRKINTQLDGKEQQPWRPKAVYHYIQDRNIEPDFVVDISPWMDLKLQSVKAYTSQFYDPSSKEPETPISTNQFLEFLIARNRHHGRDIGVDYAEAFTAERSPGINNLFDLR
ncbi:MAG: bacillithiol biosynthesis deacetylase BshB1 [Bacteroidia bacterium]